MVCLLTCVFYLPPVGVAAVVMAPMVTDGTIQLLTRYESTNSRRAVTGFLFGYALCALFLLFNISGFRSGYNLVA